MPGDYASLGADGFGFSDTRAAARRFFHIDGPSMAVRALQMLVERGEVPEDWPAKLPRSTTFSTSTRGRPVTLVATPDR
ncbi:pyruvate dehydrogenase E1 component [Cutibacterium acnes JCM 18909]|nr:pyruvate dehydrogenase E1 component [Cutibacterium acnes JCM 18909]